MGDYSYRTREEVEQLEDPLPDPAAPPPAPRGRRSPTRPSSTAIDEEVEAQIVEALQFAESSPWPDPATAADHVYAEPAREPVPEVPVRNAPPPAGGRELTFMKATLEALTEEMDAGTRGSS